MPKFDGDPVRFADNGDGTVSDKRLDLVWQWDDSGKDLTWSKAKSYCSGLMLAGRGGWRLPTIGELRSLIDEKRPADSRIAAVFRNRARWFWSGSAYQPAASNAWNVAFNDGYSSYDGITLNFRVRCVR